MSLFSSYLGKLKIQDKGRHLFCKTALTLQCDWEAERGNGYTKNQARWPCLTKALLMVVSSFSMLAISTSILRGCLCDPLFPIRLLFLLCYCVFCYREAVHLWKPRLSQDLQWYSYLTIPSIGAISWAQVPGIDLITDRSTASASPHHGGKGRREGGRGQGNKKRKGKKERGGEEREGKKEREGKEFTNLKSEATLEESHKPEWWPLPRTSSVVTFLLGNPWL